MRLDTKDKIEAEIDLLIKTLPEGYEVVNISSESSRVIRTSSMRYQISEPKILVFKRGGATNRVIDLDGTSHCYTSPETGNSVVSWTSKDGQPTVVI